MCATLRTHALAVGEGLTVGIPADDDWYNAADVNYVKLEAKTFINTCLVLNWT